MKKIMLLFLLALFCRPAFAELYEEAQDALNDNIYPVAIYKLEKFLTQKPASKIEKKARIALARALVSNDEPAKAIDCLKPLGSDAEAQFLLAQALIKTGDWAGALRIFDKLQNSTEGEQREEAVLGRAAILKSMNRPDDALALLSTDFTVPAIRNRARLLAAEIHLEKGNLDAAQKDLAQLKESGETQKLAVLLLTARLACKRENIQEGARLYDEVIQKASKTDPRIAALAVEELADAYVETSRLPDAEAALEKFIQENPSNPRLADVFQKLDEIYFREGENASSELKKWGQEPDTERGALAKYFAGLLSLRNHRTDRAQEDFEDFLKSHPHHSLVPEARLHLGRNTMGGGHYVRAIEHFKQGLQSTRDARLTAALWFAIGDAEMARNDYVEARRAYLNAATHTDFLSAAGYNAELARIRGALPDAVDASGEASTSDSLRLMRALELARQRDPAAQSELQTIANRKDGLISESAGLALAEMSFLANKPDEAKSQLNAIQSDGLSDVSMEKADYLKVFIEDNDAQTDAVAETRRKAEKFLKQYPNSEFTPIVRMKLGEACFRQGDYANARINFLDVATANPKNTALSEQALFLAAESESRSLGADSIALALEHFEEVASAKGALAPRARLEQARIKNGMNQDAEALVILDQLLASNPPPEIRYQALIEKGETLYRRGQTAPENYQKAVEVFQMVGDDPAASVFWKNQALTKAGMALAKAGDKRAALVAYYDVLNAPSDAQPEYFWYYKAGFEAGNLLEADRSWKEAIAIYEKMGRTEGPRSQEARERVNKLRLANLIWEED